MVRLRSGLAINCNSVSDCFTWELMARLMMPITKTMTTRVPSSTSELRTKYCSKALSAASM